MKKIFAVSLLSVAFSLPGLAHASILDELVGAVKDIQKQVVDLVSIKIDLPKSATSSAVLDKNWKSFADREMGFEVRYPADWSTTTMFSQIAQYKKADAFVRNSRIDFLSKIIKPSSTSIEIAVQDSAVFFQTGDHDEMVSNLNKWTGRISTSTKQVGSSTALYILHSGKTDSNKFGGGSTEKYVFQKGSSTIVAEANYASDIPAGPVKVVFDKMLQSFKFTDSVFVFGTTTVATSTSASSSDSLAATSSVNQAAGVELSR